MEETNESKFNVILRLPVKVEYRVLQTYLQKMLLGKILSKGKAHGKTSDHARIQRVLLERSNLDNFDLAVHTRLKLLTTFFRNKKIAVTIHLSLKFDNVSQQLMIQHYKLEGENNGWFTNTLIEKLINNFLYARLKNKMKIDLMPPITKRIEQANEKMISGLVIGDGISLTGKIDTLKIDDIIAGENNLLVLVKLMSNNVLNIHKIDL